MSPCDFEYFQDFFNSYVKEFYSNDPDCQKNIILKKEHTLRVCDDAQAIALSLNITQDELLLAKTAALFHDIGRFHQFKTYGTYDDSISINHAELSTDIAETSGVLNKLSSYEKDIIIKAVRYHNMYKIPEGESEKCLFISKLVRDADKLDIYKVLTEYYAELESDPNPAVEHDLPDNGSYSPKILDDILNLRNSNNKYKETRYDMRLITLTWIFDVNFKRTLELICERGYIDKTLAVLPDNEDMFRVRNTLYKFIGDK